MRKLLLALVAALLLTGTLVATSPAQAGPVGRGEPTVPHTCTNWAWSGPQSWTASCGTYGITITGDRGATLDLGFSTTICAKGATYAQSVKNYYKSVQASLKESGWKLDATSPIARPQGASPHYRSQMISFHTGRGAKKMQGVATFDYDFTSTSGGTSYCYQRSIARYAKASAWNGVKGTLAKVEDSLAYSGPGGYEAQD
ncbi:hypothetical protein ABLE68_20855 [Nocardioides sp. CN2-186]|uniref:hypothetical protein n=1 Tax=Nocardioides tweenelious TaxID=3156607 RepID=UPI0032B5288F